MPNTAPQLTAKNLADSAIDMADSLTKQIRSLNGNTNIVKSMISDIWANRDNRPFVTTVYEAIQEVKQA